MINVCCALIHNKLNEVLVTQRSSSMSLPLKWEFPGGKIEPNESPKQCIIREIKEELDIKITVKELLPASQFKYPSIVINLIPFICEHKDGVIILKEHADFKWLNRNELLDLEWADADVAIVDYYLNHFHVGT
ncbi:(deoxy)nucleoside triphosphate pyrophosphohydrolase [Mucilaginibacter sp.]